MELNKELREEMLNLVKIVITKCPMRFNLKAPDDCNGTQCINCWKYALEDSLKEEE